MWRDLTETDLAGTLSEKEIAAYRQSAAGAEGGDPIAALLTRTARLVRSYIRAGGRVSLPSDDASIPEAMVSPACDYAAFDVLKRMPVAVGEDRRRAREQAISLFERLAEGRVVPESPDGEDSASERRASFLPRRRLLD